MSKSVNRLRVFRIRSGYSEKQVADYLGIKDPKTITCWEQGETMPNSINPLVMCKLYGVKLSDTYPVLYKQCVREVNARLKELKKIKNAKRKTGKQFT